MTGNSGNDIGNTGEHPTWGGTVGRSIRSWRQPTEAASRSPRSGEESQEQTSAGNGTSATPAEKGRREKNNARDEPGRCVDQKQLGTIADRRRSAFRAGARTRVHSQHPARLLW